MAYVVVESDPHDATPSHGTVISCHRILHRASESIIKTAREHRRQSRFNSRLTAAVWLGSAYPCPGDNVAIDLYATGHFATAQRF